MTKITDKKPDLSWMDEPIRADAWRNLYFDKHGKSYSENNLHPSEAVCLQVAINFVRLNDLEPGIYYPFDNGGRMKWSEFSHAIQIPVKP